MPYFTKREARAAARSTVIAKAHSVKSAAQILREDRQAAKDTESFDVFLSHSITDADLVLGIKRLLEARNLKVYVDWDTDGQLDRRTVSSETAAVLRRRMGQSASLIYLATEAASTSKWMPWELGYFDGLRRGQVAIMPLMENENDQFSGQEYLGLYPEISQGTYMNSQQRDVFVKGKERWTTLAQFKSGKPIWKSYENAGR